MTLVNSDDGGDGRLMKDDVIKTDICTIGGGASGTYAAVRLHDLGQKVLLIEREAVLGGRTNTYIDPQTNQTVDYGVESFRTLPVVEEYFQHLGISYNKIPSSSSGNNLSYFNLRTGQVVSNFRQPDLLGALARYGQEVAKYPALEYGFYLPDPVPDELLMSFGKFVSKYNISDALQMMFHGYGNILQQPTLYVMKYFGPTMLQNLTDGFFSTSNRNNSGIYEKALEVLRPNVLLRSEVVLTNRSAASQVEIHVQTPSGRKLVRSKKLLVTIPPQLDNLIGFDLDPTERSLFSQFQNVGYYNALVRNTGLPDGIAIRNVDADTPYNLPSLPGLYQIAATAVHGSPSTLPAEMVKSDALSALKLLKNSGLSKGTAEPQLVAFQSHTPFLLTVSSDAIKSGFYNKLYALQGHRNTFYTGAAFHAHDSGLLWRFTEALLSDLMVAS